MIRMSMMPAITRFAGEMIPRSLANQETILGKTAIRTRIKEKTIQKMVESIWTFFLRICRNMASMVSTAPIIRAALSCTDIVIIIASERGREGFREGFSRLKAVAAPAALSAGVLDHKDGYQHAEHIPEGFH